MFENQLSIVIPTLNAPDELLELLQQLADCPEFEVILINQSHRVISSQINNINFREIIIDHQVCASFARNMGAEYASGKYILFLDDDAIFVDQTHKKINSIFGEERDYYLFNKGYVKDGKYVGNKEVLKNNNHWTIIKFIVEWNICIKKTTFLKIGMFPDIGPGSSHLANCGEAFILGSRLIKISKNFKYFDCIKISHPPMWIKKPYLTCIAYYYGAGYAAGEGTKQFSKFYRLLWIIRTYIASLRDFLYPLDNMLAPSELKYNKLKYKFLISYFRILGLYDAISNKLPRKKKWN